MDLRTAEFTIRDFEFASGGLLPELRLRYRTLGEPRRDASGAVCNAILILHGTTGSGAQFLRSSFADELFQPGQLLDSERHFIILPDGIGHGGSSKPSDGMRLDFPRYGYRDMIRAQHLLLTEGLGIAHLRLVMGTSMGGMQTWLWGIHYPDFMDFLVPLASLPAEIAGRNRIIRKMIMDSISCDPAWRGGEYDEQPPGLINAIHLLIMMTSCPRQWQVEAPTRAAADVFLAQRIRDYASMLDANDMLYAFAASEDYNPAPDLGRIKAPLLAINSADDQVNPPELGIMEAAIRQVERGRSVLLPIDEHTRGHGTHTLAGLWKHHLAAFLAEADAGHCRPIQ
ncbi:MAG: alpha/beta fold hydrolase [Chloroflexota bacterium]|nr:alpha/beta fold hydrolase [Chloroflexota bacterium]